jgi:multiple sugar transport system ATP-binding protein
MATIVCDGLIKEYGGNRVLHGVDLMIQDREFVVLLGPSGCGKSTILRMIAGLEDISGGTLSIDDRVLNDVAPGDRGVAMVFQNYALYPHMTVRQNIAFGLQRLKVPKAEIEARVRKVTELLGVAELLDRRPKQLSGGQQQRVAMARAMIKTPKVFLFDEPLSNLDAKLREHLRVEIKKLHLLLETTTVFVTHDQLEAMTLADRIVVMKDGRIEQIGAPREIYRRPASRFVADFIGTPSMNLVELEVAEVGARPRLVAGDLEVVVDGTRYHDLVPGHRVTLGIRPRDIRLAQDADSDDRFDRQTGQVEIEEVLSDETLIVFRAGGQEFRMLIDDVGDFALGSTIEAALDRAAMHLFDTGTGRSLASVSLDERQKGR